MTRRLRGAALVSSLALISWLLAAPGLSGQVKVPTLGGHRFVPNNLTADPFPSTSIRTTLGMGKALDLVLIPDFEVGGQPVQGVTGDLLFANLDVEIEWAVQDWMSVWLEANVLGRLGSDTGTLLTEGVSLITGFELGWLFRLMETDRTQLSGTAQIWSDNFTIVSLADWAEGIIAGENVPLVRKAPVVRTGGGLRFAWAITDWLGALGTGELGYGESAGVEPANDWFTQTSAALSIDLNPVWDVPVGFGLGYRHDSFPREAGDPDKTAHGGLFRITYTGRDDFIISLDLSSTKSTLTNGSDVTIGFTGLTMRYYF
jgi:hypothetical protein